MKYPNFNEEIKLWQKGYKRIAGLDEAGRGPLAGPVVAAAVVINPKPKCQMPKINDSKKLSSKKREEIYKILTAHHQIGWGIGQVSEKIIDKINILEATKLAMRRAIKNLEKKLEKKSKSSVCQKFHDRRNFGQVNFLIIDGNFGINLNIPKKSIIKADEKVFSCALASIFAKVIRDRSMLRYHKKYPEYGFDRHKGYPTKLHKKMLKKYGPCRIHRRSFKPIVKLLNC